MLDSLKSLFQDRVISIWELANGYQEVFLSRTLPRQDEEKNDPYYRDRRLRYQALKEMSGHALDFQMPIRILGQLWKLRVHRLYENMGCLWYYVYGSPGTAFHRSQSEDSDDPPYTMKPGEELVLQVASAAWRHRFKTPPHKCFMYLDEQANRSHADRKKGAARESEQVIQVAITPWDDETVLRHLQEWFFGMDQVARLALSEGQDSLPHCNEDQMHMTDRGIPMKCLYQCRVRHHCKQKESFHKSSPNKDGGDSGHLIKVQMDD